MYISQMLTALLMMLILWVMSGYFKSNGFYWFFAGSIVLMGSFLMFFISVNIRKIILPKLSRILKLSDAPAHMSNIVTDTPEKVSETVSFPRSFNPFQPVSPVFQPEKPVINLGTRLDGTPHQLDATALQHTLVVGSTDRGKTNILYLLWSGLIKVGHVTFCSPAFVDVDPNTGMDMRTLARKSSVASSYEQIRESVLRAYDTMLQRQKDRANQVAWDRPYYLIVDELNIILLNDSTLVTPLQQILYLGRQMGVFLITAAHSAAVESIGATSAVREQFSTFIYIGGEDTVAASLLGMQLKDLRHKITSLAGLNSRWAMVKQRGVVTTLTVNRFKPVAYRVLDETPAHKNYSPAAYEALRLMREDGLTQTQAIERAYNVTAGASQRYQAARAEFLVLFSEQQ